MSNVALKKHGDIKTMLAQVKKDSTPLSASARQSLYADAFEETFHQLGINKFKDIIDPNSGNIALSANELFKKNVKLGYTSDSVFNGTGLITGVMEQVTPYIQMETVRNLFPEAEYSAETLYLDMFDEIVGMTHNVEIDGVFPQIQKRGIETQQFKPASAGEMIVIEQQEILFLRDPGNQNISIRGLAAFMAKWSEQLSHRGLVKQLNDIYTAIFTGEYYWKNKAISYQIPSGNRISTATTLSGQWGTITNNNTTYNPLANPIYDLSVIFNNLLKTYRGLKKKIIMNPNTHQLIVQNPNVISRVPFIYANNNLVSKDTTGGVTADTLLRYFLGGDLGIEVLIDNSVYIPDANDPNGNTAGVATYILPNYQIWVYIDTDGFGKPLGEYAYTISSLNGGNANPKPGKYFAMVDTSISNTIDGFTQPRIALIHGWNGSPRIMRNLDIWTINVGPA